MPATPILTAQGSPARRFASGPARALTWLGLPIFAALAFISLGWTALFLIVATMGFLVWRRTRRRRWELDAPGPEASFRFGPQASRGVRLADLAGVVVVPFPGASSRGIPVTRDHEQWWLVDATGSALGRASTEGLDPELVEHFRTALAVPFVPVGLAKRAGALPSGMPWWSHRPRRALLVAVVVTVVVMIAVIAVPPYWA